jgi:ubiquinone/menaquinone biosynthesis C-methylase UbiE
MSRLSYRLGHHLLGIEGLALLRAGLSVDEPSRRRRVDEIRTIAARLDELPYSATREAPPVASEVGYAAWASSFDAPGNVTIALEQDVVHALLGELPTGCSVLDAGCGTGRHTVFLAARGHDVVGIDTSPEMLAFAAAKVPAARFELAELERIPLEDDSVDAAICCLVLSHSRDIGPAVRELGRVLRPGGRLIISNPHPLATGLLGWRATVTDESGHLVVIPEYPHTHGEYLTAFSHGSLRVAGCFEPSLTERQAREEAKAGLDEAFAQALTGFPVVIVWDLVAVPG